MPKEVRFDVDDAVEIALLQQRLVETQQALSAIIGKYNCDGWQIVSNEKGRWIGACPPVLPQQPEPERDAPAEETAPVEVIQ